MRQSICSADRAVASARDPPVAGPPRHARARGSHCNAIVLPFLVAQILMARLLRGSVVSSAPVPVFSGYFSRVRFRVAPLPRHFVAGCYHFRHRPFRAAPHRKSQRSDRGPHNPATFPPDAMQLATLSLSTLPLSTLPLSTPSLLSAHPPAFAAPLALPAAAPSARRAARSASTPSRSWRRRTRRRTTQRRQRRPR